MVDFESNLDLWIDGRWDSLDKPQIYANQHGFNYGTTGFDGGCTYRREGEDDVIIFRPEDRFIRFREQTARELFLNIEQTPEQLTEITKELIRRNEAKLKRGEVIRTLSKGQVLELREFPQRWYVRPVVTHSARSLGVYTPPETGVLIYIEPFGRYHGDDAFKNGLKLKIVEQRRIDPRSLSSKAKLSAHYVIGYKACKAARDAGANESILLDMFGYVADGSGGSPCMVKNGVLYFPRGHSSLNGIVRRSMAELARKELKMKVRQIDFSPEQFYRSDEIMMTGNAVEVTHAREVDGHLIGDGSIGPYVKQFQDMFFGTVLNDPNLFPNCEKYQHWCVPVYSNKKT